MASTCGGLVIVSAITWLNLPYSHIAKLCARELNGLSSRIGPNGGLFQNNRTSRLGLGTSSLFHGCLAT